MVFVLELQMSDVAKLRSLISEAWQLAGPAALGWTGATDENIKEIASESFLRGLVGNPNLRVFIGKLGEDVAGFCAIRKVDSHIVELAGIVVRQDQQGKGIGSELFMKAKGEAVDQEFTTMLVKTEPANEEALSFYQRKGFVERESVVEEFNGAK